MVAFEMGIQQNSTKHVGKAFAAAVLRKSFGLSTVAGALLTLTGSYDLSNLGIDGIDPSFPMKSSSRTASIQAISFLCERHYPSFVDMVVTMSRLKRMRSRPLITRTQDSRREFDDGKNDREDLITTSATQHLHLRKRRQ
jgi:hypothetical protein